MNTIIHYSIFQNQHLQQTISFLLKFICKHIPRRQWAFDDSNSPKYRKFKVDEPPLAKKKESEMCWYYKDFIAYIKRKYGKDIKPVKRQGVCDIPDDYIYPHCNAPKEYLYRNNGSHSQVICKVCGRSSSTFVPNNNISLSCPHCSHSLVAEKDRKSFFSDLIPLWDTVYSTKLIFLKVLKICQ